MDRDEGEKLKDYSIVLNHLAGILLETKQIRKARSLKVYALQIPGCDGQPKDKLVQ